MARRAKCCVASMLACGLLMACDGATPPAAASTTPRLAGLLGAYEVADFPKADTPREFVFPADHGPHPRFRNEWWYLTGNLDDTAGQRIGYEVTFFRFALSPEPPDSVSDWSTNQVYIAHLAISAISSERFFFAERMSRGAQGLAGAQGAPVRVWLDDWALKHRPAGTSNANWQLAAGDTEIGLDLRLEPLREPLLQGRDGLSQKSAEPGNASYYYSVPRLQTAGTVRIGDDEHTVQGLSWLDREWSSSALGPRQAGWDWFALQLDDGSDLMYYQLRLQDGGRDEYSAGTLATAEGEVRRLARDDVDIAVLDYWDSPRGGRYPHEWRLKVPREELDLQIVPAMADQELATFVRYWEGAVDVSGTRGGERVTGRGYVELTGYADETR